MEAAGSDTSRRRRGRRFVIVGAVVVGVVGLAVGVFAYLWSQADARPVTLEEARRRFRGDRIAGAESVRPYTPPEGVYAYEGSGSESLSTPPKTQTEGPGMPGTVRHGTDGCWTFRLDYSTNHWREWDFCTDDSGMRLAGTRVFQRWDFVVSTIDNLADTRCEPPAFVIETGMEAGATWRRARCRGTNTRIDGTLFSAGTHRFIGQETVRIGGRRVDALHVRIDAEVTGSQVGSEAFDLWLSDDGLPVQGRQRIVIDSDSPVGHVTYTQEGSFALVDPPP